MNRFAELLDRVAYEPSRNNKLSLMTDYFRHTPDPERVYALAAMTGALSFQHAKPGVIRALIAERTDPVLFEMSYDYVGAPWNSGGVGNGGLSVRKKTKMLTITQTVMPFQSNEDVYFAFQTIVPLLKPSFQEAQKFAVETVFYEQPFGIHAPWKYLNEHEMGILLEKYPAIQELIDLQ